MKEHLTHWLLLAYLALSGGIFGLSLFMWVTS
jgi:hypothetical protein